jgi:hypothetical protein
MSALPGDCARPYRYRIENLHCAACEQRVRELFADDHRISRIDVDMDGRTIVIHASAVGSTTDLTDRLTNAGFAPTPHAPIPDA